MIDKTKHIVSSKSSLKDALRLLNSLGENLTLFVLDDSQKLCGVITDGDIRRSLLNGITIEQPVEDLMNTKFKFLQRNNYSLETIDEFRKLGVKILPIVNSDFQIIRLINLSKIRSLLPVDALIMAGGRGERLRPLTLTTPKPMLPVGSKPIIEHNVDRLISYGIDNLHISLKYLGEQIEDHFKDGSDKGIDINYINEVEPLGTIGALSLIKEFKHDTLLVMNSDLLTNIDFEDFYRTFLNEDASMAIASISYVMSVPYAVLETTNGRVSSLKEKPNYTYDSNAGIYLIKKSCLKHIPENSFFNATDLIEKLIASGEVIISYNLLGYWLDIGRHEDYLKAQEDIKHIKL